MSNLIEGFLGKSVEGKKSRMPARLDYWQSATGLFLALFMWGHMFFVSSILVSKDFMYTVTKMFEGQFIFGESKPVIVSILVLIVLFIFIVHATLAIRKIPSKYRQYQALRVHIKMMDHEDTTLWFVQVYTGFAMLFLGSAHLFIILTAPENIGPYSSSDALISGWLWPVYLALLLAVEFHGAIGLYRLCVKWGWFEGKDARATRKRLKKIQWGLIIFFVLLGLTTMGAYMKIGLEHRGHVGQRYQPTAQIQMIKNSKIIENMNVETSFRSNSARRV